MLEKIIDKLDPDLLNFVFLIGSIFLFVLVFVILAKAVNALFNK